MAVDLDRRVRRLGLAGFPHGATSVARVKVGKDFHPRSATARRVLADRLREVA
ncbi:MAG: hypothetical protein U0R64_10480 [Candidatus Nanopelagicales bacterium]